AEQSGLSVAALRYPNIYGPGQSGTRSTGVIAIFMHQMLRGLPVTIYGDGSASYQYLYIDDLIRAHDAVLPWFDTGTPSFTLCNLNGFPATIFDLISRVRQCVPAWTKTPNFGYPRPGEQQLISMVGDSAEKAFGWAPGVDLSTGIGHVADAARKLYDEEKAAVAAEDGDS
ncbi:unnamed protein product, partial [marine sediment metagenome]